MHPVLSAFPSKYFYEGKLIDGITPASRLIPKGFSWPQAHIPLAFVHVVGKEEGESDQFDENEWFRKRPPFFTSTRPLLVLILSLLSQSVLGAMPKKFWWLTKF